MALERFEFFQRARPVQSQQTGQTTIRENPSARLASSAVIRFIIRVANSLNLFSTSRTRLSIAPVDRHFLAKRGHPFREARSCLCAQTIYPERKCLASRIE